MWPPRATLLCGGGRSLEKYFLFSLPTSLLLDHRKHLSHVTRPHGGAFAAWEPAFSCLWFLSMSLVSVSAFGFSAFGFSAFGFSCLWLDASHLTSGVPASLALLDVGRCQLPLNEYLALLEKSSALDTRSRLATTTQILCLTLQVRTRCVNLNF